MTPTTKAGWAFASDWEDAYPEFADRIAAIEAEARADLLGRLAAGVREMRGVYSIDPERRTQEVYRDDVLALIEEARK